MSKSFKCAVAEGVFDDMVMIVNVTSDGAGGYVSDKNHTEIYDAYNEGKLIYVRQDTNQFPLRNVSKQVAYFGDFNPRTGLASELLVANNVAQFTRWRYSGEKQS